jgi:hypothetical protein
LRWWEAWAQAATFPRRLLIVYSSAGLDDFCSCTGTGTGYTLSAGFQPLAPFKSKLTILDGLRIPDHISEEHPDGRSSMLTARPARPNSGGATGISFDKFAARALSNGTSLFCGPNGTSAGGGVDQPVSWHASGTPNDAFIDGIGPLLRALFPGVSPSPTSGTDAGVSAVVRDQLALHQHLQAELRRLRKVAPPSALEKLDLHLLALQQLAAGLEPAGGGEPRPSLPSCAVPSFSAPTEQDQVSLAVAHALACGRVRVGVIRLGGDEPIHTYSHYDNPGDLQRRQQTDQRNAQHVANLLGYLDAFPEGSGTLLSNTLVVWTSEVSGSYQKSPDIHSPTGVPMVLAGGLGGTIKLGQRIVVPNTRTNGEFYRTVGQLMGVPNAVSFGDPSFGGASLPEIVL